jgi:hypothetical protein
MLLDRFRPRGFSPPRRLSRIWAPGFLHPMPDRIRIVAPLPSEDSLPALRLARSSRSHPTVSAPTPLARGRSGLRLTVSRFARTLRRIPLHNSSSTSPLRLPSCRFLRAHRHLAMPPARPRLQGLHPLSRPRLQPRPCGRIPNSLFSHGFLFPLQGTSKSTVSRLRSPKTSRGCALTIAGFTLR